MATNDMEVWTQVLALVTRETGIRDAYLSGRSRTVRVSVARRLLVGLARRCSSLSLAEIGHLLGRDHTTILHLVQAFERDAERREARTVRALELAKALRKSATPWTMDLVDLDPEAQDPGSFPGLRVTYQRPDGTRWVGLVAMTRER